LNRENYLKIAQNLNKKLLKLYSVKQKIEQNCFGPWPLAAHGPFWARGALCGG
jgi:hypothetical protein